jgi:hypothetical protein
MPKKIDYKQARATKPSKANKKHDPETNNSFSTTEKLPVKANISSKRLNEIEPNPFNQDVIPASMPIEEKPIKKNDKIYCINCGYPLKKDYKFCINCGSKIIKKKLKKRN